MVGQCHWEWDWDGVEFMMIENLYIACEMASDSPQMTLSWGLCRVWAKSNGPPCHSLVGSREMTRASSSSKFHQFNFGSGNLDNSFSREKPFWDHLETILRPGIARYLAGIVCLFIRLPGTCDVHDWEPQLEGKSVQVSSISQTRCANTVSQNPPTRL